VLKDISSQKRKENLLTETNVGLEQLLQEQLHQTRDANRQLKQMNARLERSREEERKKISRELHDELGQMLTGAKLHLSYVAEELDVQDPELRTMLMNLLDILDKSVQSVRNLSMELRPGLVEDMGLFNAIQFHATRFSSQTKIPVQIVNEVPELEIEPSISIHVFRIFQEALNNISKHAKATMVNVFITMEEGIFRMQISDNGEGFNVSANGNKSTLGLTSMQERSEIVNGTYHIKSAKGVGTVIEIKIPLMQTG
jgi:signal transduction histidine kinase